MLRKYDFYLNDILTAIKRIKMFMEKMSLSEFERDLKTQSSVIWQLVVMGEAVSRLPENFTKKHSAVPWQKVKDFRNVVVHKYDQIRVDLLWEIIQNNLPKFAEQIKEIVSNEKNQ